MFEYDKNGIYICIGCGEPYSPGHNTRCITQPEHKQDGKTGGLSNIGRDIDVGMRMIHANEDDGYFDITEFTKRGE